MDNPASLGRDALRRQAWSDARALFAAADEAGRLGPAELDAAALTAYLTGHDDECEALWARAHRAWLDDGHPARAARSAFWLGLPLLLRGEMGRGGGWLARGARLLEDRAPDCPERGLFLVPAALRKLATGDPVGAAETCSQVEEIGERFGDADVLAFGRLGHGQALIAAGRTAEGVSLLDEAMVAVTADDVSPMTAGLVYCAVLLACHDTFDLARADEWTAAMTRWCDVQQDLVPFRGECLIHRAEVLQVRGDWPGALAEARRACERLADRPAAGRARYQLGELHRLRGDATAADAAFRAASAAGRAPQPGCALLRLDQGHLDAASAMIERAVDTAGDGGPRAGMLPAYVEVALARKAMDPARAAADELIGFASRRDAAALHAHAAHTHGRVLLAAGDPHTAAARLQESCARWQELAAPYEVARVRAVAALACRALGDDDGADMELEAARSTFARLGAEPELERLAGLPAASRAGADSGLTARELDVLALVAEGRTNQQIAAALVISPHTARRHLQNIFGKLGVSSRAAATAHAFQHELVPGGRMVRTDH